MSTDPGPATAYEPVHIHVASMAPEVTLGQALSPRRDQIRTRFGTETVDDTNPVRPLLPDHPDRVCVYVQVTGGDVYLCDSESKASQAADAAASGLGSILPATNTGPWPVRGTQAVWAAQVTPSKTCVVSFTADYRA